MGKEKNARRRTCPTRAHLNSDGIYAYIPYNFENDGEHQKPQIADFDYDTLVKEQRSELRSNRMNDPSRINNPQAATSHVPAQEQRVVLAPPVLSPPLKSMNILKTEGLRMIIEEKHLSTNRVIDRYLEIMDCVKSHKFQIFTMPMAHIFQDGLRNFSMHIVPDTTKEKTNNNI